MPRGQGIKSGPGATMRGGGGHDGAQQSRSEGFSAGRARGGRAGGGAWFAPGPDTAVRGRGAGVPARLYAGSDIQVAETVELRHHRRQQRSLADSWRRGKGGVQRAGRRRRHAHLVHDCGEERRSLEGARAARLLGRQRKAQRRSADRRFLRPESRQLSDLRIAVPRVLARPLAELLFRHAVPPLGARDRHERGHAGRQFVLFEHRLHQRPAPARRRALLPRAIPAGRAVRARGKRQVPRSISTESRTTCSWRHEAADT